ncbi:class I SAM-dependent methyltransferase [Amphibacillus sp. MSJ-3]|uniref:class I SAM-dependent methyltransferase n=1 Tax=Amphibacillus sp. MSJ-3 TaxID=2841505 RepID=UPI001C0F1454|nr:class I SAM-dependent methyltransferase [Amphibacillus sp. MSJ-3]MBU5593718.1 class I SAM-dependent methyltransferase [Amphibacillus sp. MSJ-3]
MDFNYTTMLAEFNIGSAHPGGFSATKRAWDLIQAYPHDIILDVGCGTGKTLAYLAETTSSQLFGIDNHKMMIEKAKQRLKTNRKIDLFLADLTKLPFQSDTIDCLLSESVTSFADIAIGLKEYSRVLRKQGILCLIEITAKEQLASEDRTEINQFYGTQSILTKSEWEGAIHKAGFTIIDRMPLPATSEGRVDLDMDMKIDPIYFDFLGHHFHLIEKLQNQIIGYLFLCQKETVKAD